MRKLNNFRHALSNLHDIYNYEEPYDNVILTGLVGLYELCFEQSWKALKEILEDQGYHEGQTGSPKLVLKTAFQAGMIMNEGLWLTALTQRNNVVHSYNKAVALSIVRDTKDKFYNMFTDLLDSIEKGT
jgi:nucleotidyltransferase substrate binding protein (TIGR01987 family)